MRERHTTVIGLLNLNSHTGVMFSFKNVLYNPKIPSGPPHPRQSVSRIVGILPSLPPSLAKISNRERGGNAHRGEKLEGKQIPPQHGGRKPRGSGALKRRASARIENERTQITATKPSKGTLTTTSFPPIARFPSAMHHRALAAKVKPSPAPKNMSTKTTFTRVAQIVYRTFRLEHAMRKKAVMI
jgi:hypothetical protein